jgi:HD-GYP domain-containing protein (c-di-GMP phosphodiesterase class II)
MAVPLFTSGQFSGMLAAVVSLDHVAQRLKDASAHDRVVYVVDAYGQVVVHPNTRGIVPGRDLSSTFRVVSQFRDRPKGVNTTESVQFTIGEKGQQLDMIGTYSTIAELGWAVIAQRSLTQARIDAGVQDLTAEALKFVTVMTFVALVVGYLFALGITTPIRGLAESTRAISRGEFHERAPVRGAREISELAQHFNKMAGDIEQYVEQLKQAAEQNRELFIGSIRMLGAAIDEKDPYTRGHSGRVAKYSVIIGEALELSPEELDRLRISALLHDVGKIGVDDRVLKKPGSLTDEEFRLMKQHPTKGANIMRPVAQLKEMLPGIELHHEHVDGRGYPYGLSGDQIPLMARIIGVADTLDAITTNRPYQSAMDLEFAMKRIHDLTGTKFDPVVVEALDAAVSQGTLRLSAALVEV